MHFGNGAGLTMSIYPLDEILNNIPLHVCCNIDITMGIPIMLIRED